jgi:hypothetical protein
MTDKSKRNSAGRLAAAVVKELRAKYRSHLVAGEWEVYEWSTDEAARLFWYRCEISALRTSIDVHKRVTVYVGPEEIDQCPLS